MPVLCVVPLVLSSPPATAQFQSNLPSLGDTERSELSPVMEYKLGVEVMQKVRADRDYIDDPVVLEYLNNFGNKLVSSYPEARGEAGNDFFFFAVRDPMINAFALPGGFIGVHSALLLAAQNESELASVLSHEIGHVSQRHIARMLGQQRQDMLIPLASMLLGVLAMRGSADAGMAIVTGGSGLAMQRQLNFSRDAEREADRIGFQIMRAGGFDTSGMTAFFGRLQTASRLYSDTTPSYLRSHPLTTERIADIEARIREQPYRQHVDSFDFYLVRARMRVLQDESGNGLHESATILEQQAKKGSRMQAAAAQYGLAVIALKQGNTAKAQSLLQYVRRYAQDHVPAKRNPILASLSIEIKLAAHQTNDALKESEAAITHFPESRGIARQYADVLYAASRYEDAAQYLRSQVLLYREEPQLQKQLAKTYAAQGKQALMHMSMAESYAMTGGLSSALEQLRLARNAPDATFYDNSIIDAREHEWQARRREELKDKKK